MRRITRPTHDRQNAIHALFDHIWTTYAYVAAVMSIIGARVYGRICPRDAVILEPVRIYAFFGLVPSSRPREIDTSSSLSIRRGTSVAFHKVARFRRHGRTVPGGPTDVPSRDCIYRLRDRNAAALGCYYKGDGWPSVNSERANDCRQWRRASRRR